MMMRSGEVTSDQQAFQQVIRRLNDDVGTLINLVVEGKRYGRFIDTAPFWALLRMMFPIAESVGDLIYGNKSTSGNLISVFEHQFEAVRPGYLGKAKTLVLLYRHSLMHQDELRSLRTSGTECGWKVSFDDRSQHLQVVQPRPLAVIQFDSTAFYDDLVAVCNAALTVNNWNGEVKKRYNLWLIYDLDVDKQKKKIAAVIAEIAKL
jgi:hypothetical protein